MSLRAALAAALASLAALGAARPSAEEQRPSETVSALWVTLGDSNQLVEVDPFTFAVRRRITVDPRPHGLAASADGRTIYLTSDRTGNLQVIDVPSGRVAGQLHLGDDPNQLTLAKGGSVAFVPVRGDHEVAVVRLDPLAVVKQIAVPARPHNAYTSPDGKWVYVGAQRGNAIAAIDVERMEVAYTIPTADGVRTMQLSPDGRTIYSALSNLIGFVVVDLVERRVVQTVKLAENAPGPPEDALETYTHGLQLARGGRELWVSDRSNDLIRVVELPGLRETAGIRVGHAPHWLTLRPDGQVMFVSHHYSDSVAPIDVERRELTQYIRFERGTGPKRILAVGRPASGSAR